MLILTGIMVKIKGVQYLPDWISSLGKGFNLSMKGFNKEVQSLPDRTSSHDKKAQSLTACVSSHA